MPTPLSPSGCEKARTFIVYTNIFAILGLRAMYFLLADVGTRFQYLKISLALVLVFVGAKMLMADAYKIPIGASLGVVAALVGGSIVVSLLRAPARVGDHGRPQSSRSATPGSTPMARRAGR